MESADTADNPADTGQPEVAAEGWTGTDQAARALQRAPRTIRRYIDKGELEARKVRSGAATEWQVSIVSLQALRDRLVAEGKLKREAAGVLEEPVVGDADEAARLSAVMERIVARTESLSAEIGDLRARLELTARAESSLREELEEQRMRAEAAEMERNRLAGELEAELSKGFWRRLFGG